MTHTQADSPNWKFVLKYGQGCQVFLDCHSVRTSGSLVRARFRHQLVPHGTDKRNQKPIEEVLFDKEFDLERAAVCVHSSVFRYVDGSTSELMEFEPNWTLASGGDLDELKFLRTRETPKAKRWWSFR